MAFGVNDTVATLLAVGSLIVGSIGTYFTYRNYKSAQHKVPGAQPGGVAAEHGDEREPAGEPEGDQRGAEVSALRGVGDAAEGEGHAGAEEVGGEGEGRG